MHSPNNYKDGIFPIDAVFMPVRDANYSIHSYGAEMKYEKFFSWKYGRMGG